MTIKIGDHKILCTRKKDHREYLWNRINELRNEVIDDVLMSERNGRMPVKQLKQKAQLIKKYSRRLKLLDT
jgi:hypothetical protein